MHLQCSYLLMVLIIVVYGQNYPPSDVHWVNQYRQGFNFQCPSGEALVVVQSYYDKREGSDRLWAFECQPTPQDMGEPTECWWDDIMQAGLEWWDFPVVKYFNSASYPHSDVFVHGHIYCHNEAMPNWKEQHRIFHLGNVQTDSINIDFSDFQYHTCTNNGIVAGVQSRYYESVLDRDWQFLCCKYSRRCPYACRLTTDVPEFYEEEGHFVMPQYGYFIRGASTTFSGVQRDRQWKYVICQMTGFNCKFDNL